VALLAEAPAEPEALSLDAAEDTVGNDDATLEPSSVEALAEAEALSEAAAEDTVGKADAVLKPSSATRHPLEAPAEAEALSQDAASKPDGKAGVILEEWQTVYNKFHLKEPIVTVREPTGIHPQTVRPHAS
jgi:hypothetical protein